MTTFGPSEDIFTPMISSDQIRRYYQIENKNVSRLLSSKGNKWGVNSSDTKAHNPCPRKWLGIIWNIWRQINPYPQKWLGIV